MGGDRPQKYNSYNSYYMEKTVVSLGVTRRTREEYIAFLREIHTPNSVRNRRAILLIRKCEAKRCQKLPGGKLSNSQ
jgi:hypothetical protein